ncbi:MAG TPA: hypothetical protein VNV60_11480 [Holophagaceae bacterium]|jgi:hypothetical protein|nr:hypothetical protein [Holophagaceae bacterium]
MKQMSTLSLVGDRYLDTQHDSEYINRLETELACRGVTGIKRALYEYLAASSFWWNLVWSEWQHFRGKDIRAGWILNAICFSAISGLIGLLFGSRFLIPAFLALHIITTLIGFGLRAGTRLKEKQ